VHPSPATIAKERCLSDLRFCCRRLDHAASCATLRRCSRLRQAQHIGRNCLPQRLYAPSSGLEPGDLLTVRVRAFSPNRRRIRVGRALPAVQRRASVGRRRADHGDVGRGYRRQSSTKLRGTTSSNPSSSSGESANFRFLASINPPGSYRVRRIRILAILAVCKIGYRPERASATQAPAILGKVFRVDVEIDEGAIPMIQSEEPSSPATTESTGDDGDHQPDLPLARR